MKIAKRKVQIAKLGAEDMNFFIMHFSICNLQFALR